MAKSLDWITQITRWGYRRGSFGRRRIAQGPAAVTLPVRTINMALCGELAGSDSLMRVFISSTRTAIFDERASDRREGCTIPHRPLRRRAAQLMQQPVSANVQEQAELVGLKAMACGLVSAGIKFPVLDQVFGGAAHAVNFFVKMLAAAFETGDDEAGIGAVCRRLNAGNDLALAAPSCAAIGDRVETTNG